MKESKTGEKKEISRDKSVFVIWKKYLDESFCKNEFIFFIDVLEKEQTPSNIFQ